MKAVKQLIDVFGKHINILNTGNLVIGGIHALRLHGLVMHRDAVDFDVIIYSPTVSKEDYLESLIEKGEARDDGGRDGDEEPYRSYKIESDGATIDFLLEREKTMPNDLLCIVHNSQQIYVQGIEQVIDAKRGYFDGFEFRPKDVDDCRELKANNFDLFKKDKPVDWEQMAKDAENDVNWSPTKDDLPF